MKRILWVLIWTGVLVSPINAWATEPTPSDEAGQSREFIEEKSFTIFQKLFFSHQYDSLKCQENIFRLMSSIRDEGIDMTHVRVLFLFDKDHNRLIPTKNFEEASYGVQRPTIRSYKARIVPTRPPPPNDFKYHVCAAIFDKILDFDYTNSPMMETCADYFDRMFLERPADRQMREQVFGRLRLRVIPAYEYLHNHPQHPSFYLFDLTEKYPLMPLDRYMKDVEKLKADHGSEPISEVRGQ